MEVKVFERSGGSAFVQNAGLSAGAQRYVEAKEEIKIMIKSRIRIEQRYLHE